MELEFTTKTGEVKRGRLLNAYTAFEGGKRFIFVTEEGKQYRCIETADGKYKELEV